MLLRRIREQGITQGDYVAVRKLIVHLIVRTKNVRDGFTQLGRLFWEMSEEQLTLRNKKTRQKHRRLVTKMLYQQMKEPPLKELLSSLPAWRKKAVIKLLKAHAAQVDTFAMFEALFSQFRSSVQENSPGVATNAQLGVLRHELAPAKRMAQLADFSWKLLTPEKSEFVLGDVVGIGVCKDKPDFIHPITTNDENPLEAIVVPIAPNCAIVGSTTQRTMDVDEINIASVELSREFFVAHRVTQAEHNLANRLGDRSSLWASEDMRRELS
jgi:hypothetical protein